MITLDTVITIKKEYEADDSFFLCVASSTFGGLWKDSRTKRLIISLANEFLSEHTSYKVFFVGTSVLFNSKEIITMTPDEDVRKDFLKWWIAKLSKDSTPT